MFSAIRKRVRVSPAMVIAGLALMFAMTGGAYAAKKYLITSTKQISPSVLKSLQGKAGAAGAQGPAGAAGPQGPGGPQGAAGAGGAKGDAGAAGKDGSAGVAGLAGPTGAKGETGLKGSNGPAGVTGPVGAAGVTGPAGPTCPDGECLLPVGATETGVWSFRVSGVSEAFVSISFPFRPSSAPVLHYVTAAEQGTTPAKAEGCPGFSEEPEAAAGELCVYEGEAGSEGQLANAEAPFQASTGAPLQYGVVLRFPLEVSTAEARGGGSWAVAR